jgi:site-specific DNA-methyltransferase (adenine-specific)
MADNKKLNKARAAKNDEFYTMYSDIEAEMNAYITHNPNVFRGKTILCPCDDPEESMFARYFVDNFNALGLKKLICTCISQEARKGTATNGEGKGKILCITKQESKSCWTYLEGAGDFRSPEVTALRDEADIIITNPPFSLFREFLKWVIEGKKQFAVIGTMNIVTYKEVFPLIKEDKMWLGATIHSGDVKFKIPSHYPVMAARNEVDPAGNKFVRVTNVRWFTNIKHGQQQEELSLRTMEENMRSNKRIRGKDCYAPYDNYNAIEIPSTSAVPSDYKGCMGVPITFLDKYNPHQFEILTCAGQTGVEKLTIKGRETYKRIIIQHRPQ